MLTDERIRTWIDQSLGGETRAMQAVRERTDALRLPHEELFPSQVMLLRTLLLALRAQTVLELGTFLGYGATCIVEALDALGGGRLVTVDSDARRSEEAEAGVPISDGKTTVEFMRGDAAAVCGDLSRRDVSFDLILLDVAELSYPDLYDRCVSLLRPSGVLVVDNVLMATADGWETGDNVVERGDSLVLTALRELVAAAAGDERVWPSIVPLGSGLLLCAKR